MITVVGVGEKRGDMTSAAKKAIQSAAYVVEGVRIGYKINSNESFGDIYKLADSFDAFNSLAVDRLLALEKQYGEIVYLVSGDGLCDSTLELLKDRTDLTYITAAAVVRPATTSLLQLSAFDLFLAPQLDNLPLLVTAIDCALTASEVKLYLLKFYRFDTPVWFYSRAGCDKITLEDIDRQPQYGASCRIFLSPKNGLDKQVYTFGDLTRIMDRLTAGDGCPWDKEQTHQSIRSNMIEEAYEAVRAIDLNDTDNLIEELGDVMLQSVFHADIARRSGEFELSDVISTLCRKLYTRHTHIFGDKSASGSAEALTNWEQAKAQEKAAKAESTEGIANQYQGFPALLRAQKTAKKLIKSGKNIDCDNPLKQNIDGKNCGKILFEVAAYCWKEGLDAETLLNEFLNNLDE